MRSRARIAGLFLLAAGWLVACRALVGIEDLDVADEGKDSGTDAPTADAAAADTGLDAIAKKNAECQKSDCRRCCKEAYLDLHDLENASGTRTCICAPSKCGNAGNPCAGDGGYCAGGPVSAECVPCLDDRFSNNECTLDCKTPGCLAGLSCLRGCP